MSEDYQEQVRAAILDARFVRATLSGHRPGQRPPWIKVTLRPVLLKGRRHLQFAYYDERKCITKNHTVDDIAPLDELLDTSF